MSEEEPLWVDMEKKNWKPAEQGRGWSGVEVKLSSRLGLETSAAVMRLPPSGRPAGTPQC